MPKKKKKESWKEKRRRAALKREKALKAERARVEREIKKRHKGWPRGKVFGALFLISLCLIAYGVWQYSTESQSQGGVPLYTLTDADFSEFRGKVVVLDFFATYCKPCIEQIPHLAEIHEEYNSSDVVIISIAPLRDSEEGVKQFRDKHGMSWIVARDTVGAFEEYKVYYIPKLVILDQEGEIRYEHEREGVVSASTLSSEIESLLS